MQTSRLSAVPWILLTLYVYELLLRTVVVLAHPAHSMLAVIFIIFKV